MQNKKTLKIIMIILDIILIPLMLIQLIGGNFNIGGIIILVFANLVVFTDMFSKNKGSK